MEKNMEPFIIVGLGNPGREYEHTRHNIGFLAIDKLANAWDIKISRLRNESLVGEGKYGNRRILLVKPQTYMNNSGKAVQSFLKFYKSDVNQLLVIHDDIDLPFGSIRIRKSGGSGGQRGVESIIAQIGTIDFMRLRVGISRPPGRMDPKDYVLKKIPTEMQTDLDLVLSTIQDAIEVILTDGVEMAMTRFNHSILQDE